jgi:hypothetical protein
MEALVNPEARVNEAFPCGRHGPLPAISFLLPVSIVLCKIGLKELPSPYPIEHLFPECTDH